MKLRASSNISQAVRAAVLDESAHGAWCGLALYYLCGNLYYIFATRVLLQTPVPLLIGFINCFVVSIIPDVLLTILAISCAKRLSPIIQ